MSNIIFTQDVPGEREWLNSKFQDKINLETWNWQSLYSQNPLEIREVDNSRKFQHDELMLAARKSNTFKSLFSTPSVGDKWWCYSKKLLTSDDWTEVNPLFGEYYHALTFGRVGTVFIENLFRKRFKMLMNHSVVGSAEDSTLLVSELRKHQGIKIVMTYRRDWWGWITSLMIAKKYGYHHHTSSVAWDSLQPIAIDLSDLIKCRDQLISSWDFFCNIRCALPSNLFYLLEFQQMITKYQPYNSHQKIRYDKRELISNYDEAKSWYDEGFHEDFEFLSNNAISHLKTLNCLTDIDMDWLR
jgi:hypothetical protein